MFHEAAQREAEMDEDFSDGRDDAAEWEMDALADDDAIDRQGDYARCDECHGELGEHCHCECGHCGVGLVLCAGCYDAAHEYGGKAVCEGCHEEACEGDEDAVEEDEAAQ